MATSSSGTDRVIDIIKCFCGCSEVSRRDIERILMSNIDSNLKNPQARSLFKSFVQLGHTTFQPPALKAMLCYEECNKVREDNYNIDEDTCENIKDLCLMHRLENKLEEAYETNPEDIPAVLEEIMLECGFYLERTNDWKRFLKRLRDKIK